ncbi:nuclear intron maturase 3, mitochondrial-like isoform X1 [Apium graveolens]|uniref:nuclear intron maturase 3, mitochondrial-like isoform X1 n=1 Tax=Apium graveolens TaxID=4045 RepID=UPI003D7A9B9A
MLLCLKKATPQFNISRVSFSRLFSAKPLTKPQLKTLILKQFTHGKFTNLLQNVVASPSFLLTACHNLNSNSSKSLSTHFSLTQMAQQLANNQFNIKECCFTLTGPHCESLILPNLMLKVLIEAIRIVLECVYDDRFVTFSYGGRVGMGRHTAIRYLKNSVENPSWWFSVCFDDIEFGSKNVDTLCLVLERKIDDGVFVGMIKRFFECGVVRIELGGCALGRGFPEECGLSAILMNVYFNAFDKEIQELRLKTNMENPKLSLDDNVFHKPLKIYAVRYLDEILVITSGTKMLTMDLKHWILSFVENDLELKVDRVRSAIHSAANEKINFLGMELRAVTPSFLHPPMSEKAMRAQKKYLRQKKVERMELRNARETRRKKLGMKIMTHVFKKLKRSDEFEFDFQIENEVAELFRTWSSKVVEEFLGSIDERWSWHRKITTGDFLSLKRIRDQLPQELIDAYDDFQFQVDKHLAPVKAKSAVEEEERRVQEQEEQIYAERTVKDLTKLCIMVNAPIELIRKAVRLAGFTNSMGRPRPINSLMALEDVDIIKWYAGVGRRWLDYFCCCHNFKMVKIVVSYHLRFSCILTLAEKHESTKREAIKHYTKDLKAFDVDGTEEVHFPTEKDIKMMGDKNLSDPKPVDGALTVTLIRLASDEPLHRCTAHFCNRTDTIVYRIHLLQNILHVNPSDSNKWVPGMGAIHESFNRKCIPLCSDHISDFYTGKLTFQDIDCTSFVDVDGVTASPERS